MRSITTTARSQRCLLSCVMAGAITLSGSARADEPPVDPRPAPAPTPPTSAAPAAPPPAASSTATLEKTPDSPLPVPQSPTSQKRSETLEPRPVYQPSTPNGSRLQADPIADGAVLGISPRFAILSDMITSTEDLPPQQ